MNLSKIFSEFIKKDKDFLEAYKIVKDNSEGKIWLIGGALSRNLVSLIYGGSKVSHDFDFIIEKPIKNIKLPKGWKIKKNKFGSPKFIGPKIDIDFVPLDNVQHIRRKKLEPTIDNFLLGVPFTIQSLAYDIKKEKVIGKIGIKALKNKTFEVYDKDSASIYSKKKNLSIEKLIKKKAKSMDFKPILCSIKVNSHDSFNSTRSFQ